MTMFMMGGDMEKIYKIIYTMIVMSALEYVFRNAPALLTWGQAQIDKKMARVSYTECTAPAVVEEITSSITLIQSAEEGNSAAAKKPAAAAPSAMSERIEAVVDFICSLDASKHIRYESRLMIANDEVIALTPLIKAQVSNANKEGVLKIVIFSTRLPISQLRSWLDDLYERYVHEKTNRLGNKIYYFNEIITEPPKVIDTVTKKSCYAMERAPPTIRFTMNEFHTAKSFSNIYGSHVADLKERIDLFCNHPEWYMERGIPHTLGLLLHGVPGAGKTSTIKAVAADTNRHIFNISLREFTTQKQLDQLFYNEIVHVTDSAGVQCIYRIPMNRRVYVIEDIDCLTNVVLDREFFPREESQDNRVTLSYLLNLLDGVLETPGRILIITSNYPNNLDRALVRPGRIDVRVEFRHADRALIAEMIERFYSVPVAVEEIPKELDRMLTAAEVMECLCTHFRDRGAAMKMLMNKATAPAPVIPSSSGEVVDCEASGKEAEAEVQDAVSFATKESSALIQDKEMPEEVLFARALKGHHEGSMEHVRPVDTSQGDKPFPAPMHKEVEQAAEEGNGSQRYTMAHEEVEEKETCVYTMVHEEVGRAAERARAARPPGSFPEKSLWESYGELKAEGSKGVSIDQGVSLPPHAELIHPYSDSIHSKTSGRSVATVVDVSMWEKYGELEPI